MTQWVWAHSTSRRRRRGIGQVKTKTREEFLQEPEAAVLQEWPSYKQHVLVGAFKGFDQLTAMTKLASQFDEWGQSTPALTSWHANAPTIPVSSVNCQNRLEE
ncbi:uncharacterized protein ACWYII_047135 isoform 2-T2 [Salvelinus alpinus]